MYAPVASVPNSVSRRNIRRLLVVRLSSMGDVLHTLPAVAALRVALPETYFGWVVEERWADLVRSAVVIAGSGNRSVADQLHLVQLKSWRKTLLLRPTMRKILVSVRNLRAVEYDVAVDFQGAVRSSMIASLSGANSIFGFANPRENAASMFYTTSVVATRKHVIEQNLELASGLAARPLHSPELAFVSINSNAGIKAELPSDYVVVSPGAGWGAKQWPAERYGEVANRLAKLLAVPVVINAGPGQQRLLDSTIQASAGTAHPLSCSPAELIDVIRGARLLIGGDTGPVHLAAALGVPVVGIYGPTDPARTGPFGTRSIVLRNSGSLTSLSHQPNPDPAMLDISPDDVVGAAIKLLTGAQ